MCSVRTRVGSDITTPNNTGCTTPPDLGTAQVLNSHIIGVVTKHSSTLFQGKEQINSSKDR